MSAPALGVAHDQRLRPYMEDRVVTGACGDGLLVAIFDGHGGAAVAEHAAARAPGLVEAALGRGLRGEALWRQVFPGLDLDVRGCGSTGTLLLLRGGELSVAWVGDSRAILVGEGRCQVLTPDHRIERADERRRVLQAGARLAAPYVTDPLTGGGLMVTRALGDVELRRVGITPEPEGLTLPLGAQDVGFVAATDGLWDVVPSEEAAEACRREEPARAAERLVRLVAARHGADNVTVVVCRF